MINVENCLSILGSLVQDKVTLLKGVVTSVSFDLYGCVQALVHPGIDKDNKLLNQNWFDFNRLELLSGTSKVMSQPNFEFEKGPAEKPEFTKV